MADGSAASPLAAPRTQTGQLLGVLGRLTSAHRAELAEQHIKSAGLARRLGGLSRPGDVVWRKRSFPNQPAKDVLVSVAEAMRLTAEWHEKRAQGQRNRMTTVAECGQNRVHVDCLECGEAMELPAWCGVARLCQGCAIRGTWRHRAKTKKARESLLHDAARAHMYNARRGGRFSERHIVLTVPHVVMGISGERHRNVAACRDAGDEPDEPETARFRVQVHHAAWRRFSILFQGYRRRCLRPSERPFFAYCRASEWTPGADGMGHPHTHMWNHGPFVPEHDYHDRPNGMKIQCETKILRARARRAGTPPPKPCDCCRKFGGRTKPGIRSWWARALTRATGIPWDPEQIAMRIGTLDDYKRASFEFVRELHKPDPLKTSPRLRRGPAPGAALIDYTEPWSFGMLDRDTLAACSERVLAAVYIGFEGRRLTQASRGFMRRAAQPPSCRCCGVERPRRRVGIERPAVMGPPPPLPRAPVLRLVTALDAPRPPPPDPGPTWARGLAQGLAHARANPILYRRPLSNPDLVGPGHPQGDGPCTPALRRARRIMAEVRAEH